MSVEEMQDLLDRLGIEVLSVRGDEIQGTCPGHLERTGHEDRNPSWWINAETGAHICFSCGFKGGAQYLVSYVNGIEYDDAKDWITSGGPLSERFHKANAPKASVFADIEKITEAHLAAFVDPPDYALRSRGITLESAQHYGILWYERKEGWVIPIRDALTGELLGWQEKGFTGRYFNNYPKGMRKSAAIFGMQQYTGGDMIVVESPLDVARLRSVGVEGGVATYGCSVSKAQLSIIRGADRVIFAMDNDEAGMNSNKDLLRGCADFWFEAWFFDYSHTDCKDVGGMSKAEILQGLENSKHMFRGEKAFA